MPLDATNLYEALVRFSTAPKRMVEEHGAQLPVLIFDVVFYHCLTRPAQLIGLLQVVLVRLDFLIVVLLQRRQPFLNLKYTFMVIIMAVL